MFTTTHLIGFGVGGTLGRLWGWIATNNLNNRSAISYPDALASAVNEPRQVYEDDDNVFRRPVIDVVCGGGSTTLPFSFVVGNDGQVFFSGSSNGVGLDGSNKIGAAAPSYRYFTEVPAFNTFRDIYAAGFYRCIYVLNTDRTMSAIGATRSDSNTGDNNLLPLGFDGYPFSPANLQSPVAGTNYIRWTGTLTFLQEDTGKMQLMSIGGLPTAGGINTKDIVGQVFDYTRSGTDIRLTLPSNWAAGGASILFGASDIVVKELDGNAPEELTFAALGNDPLSFTDESNVVTVTHPDHGLVEGIVIQSDGFTNLNNHTLRLLGVASDMGGLIAGVPAWFFQYASGFEYVDENSYRVPLKRVRGRVSVLANETTITCDFRNHGFTNGCKLKTFSNPFGGMSLGVYTVSNATTNSFDLVGTGVTPFGSNRNNVLEFCPVPNETVTAGGSSITVRTFKDTGVITKATLCFDETWKWKHISLPQNSNTGIASFGCGITEDGKLWYWGNRRTSVSDVPTNRRIPYQIGTDTDWDFVTSGVSNIYALKEDGTIWAQGENSFGQLGQGYTGNPTSLVPIQVGVDDDWVYLSTYDYTVFAIKDDGTLWAWGRNHEGQIPGSVNTQQNEPFQIGTDSDWEKVWYSGDGANRPACFGLKADGTLYTWGLSITTPEVFGEPTDKWTGVLSTARTHTLAIKDDGGISTTALIPELLWDFYNPTTQLNLFAVEWSDDLEKFCVIAGSGSGDTVLLSDDGVTWTRHRSAPVATFLGETSIFAPWIDNPGFTEVVVSDAFSTTNNSNIVSVAISSHGFQNGDVVFIRNVSGSQNGIPASEFNKTHTIQNVTPNTFDIVLISNANTTGNTNAPNVIFRNVFDPREIFIVGQSLSGGGLPGNTFITSMTRTRINMSAVPQVSGTQTSITAHTTNNWADVVWSPELGIFCAVSWLNGGNQRVMTSPDGVNWTLQNTPDRVWRRIVWSPELGLFCAVGELVMISSDGINWTEVFGGTVVIGGVVVTSLFDVTWSPELGLFCAVGGTGVLMTSPDGVNWSVYTVGIPGTLISITWSPELGLFCAVLSAGLNVDVVYTSTDGVNWNGRNCPKGSWRTIVWAAGQSAFIAIASTGPNARSMFSFDGKNWFVSNNLSNDSWQTIAWSPLLDRFCVVGTTGPNRIAIGRIEEIDE